MRGQSQFVPSLQTFLLFFFFSQIVWNSSKSWLRTCHHPAAYVLNLTAQGSCLSRTICGQNMGVDHLPRTANDTILPRVRATILSTRHFVAMIYQTDAPWSAKRRGVSNVGVFAGPPYHRPEYTLPAQAGDRPVLSHLLSPLKNTRQRHGAI